MKEILALLLKTFGLGIIIIVGGSAWLWIPYIVSNYVGDVAYFVIIFASLIVSCVAIIFAQLKLDSLWSN